VYVSDGRVRTGIAAAAHLPVTGWDGGRAREVVRSSGDPVPMPGEVSLAHHGLLCRDARPACIGHALDVWRQPLEDGVTEYNLPGVLDLNILAATGARLTVKRDSGRAR